MNIILDLRQGLPRFGSRNLGLLRGLFSRNGGGSPSALRGLRDCLTTDARGVMGLLGTSFSAGGESTSSPPLESSLPPRPRHRISNRRFRPHSPLPPGPALHWALSMYRCRPTRQRLT